MCASRGQSRGGSEEQLWVNSLVLVTAATPPSLGFVRCSVPPVSAFPCRWLERVSIFRSYMIPKVEV